MVKASDYQGRITESSRKSQCYITDSNEQIRSQKWTAKVRKEIQNVFEYWHILDKIQDKGIECEIWTSWKLNF